MARQEPQISEKTGDVVEFKTGSTGGDADAAAGRRPYQPGSPYKVVLIGAGIILAAFVGLGTWAALAPLDSAAYAPGTVAVESNRKVVQHPEGGVIERIVVSDGARVSDQQLLVKLDPTEEQANFTAVRQKLNSALAQRARLVAEQQGADSIDFPRELVQQAETGSTQARQVMAAERDQFKERRQSLQGQIAIQREKIKQLENKINGLQAQRSSNQRQVEIMRNELEGQIGRAHV